MGEDREEEDQLKPPLLGIKFRTFDSGRNKFTTFDS